MSNNFLIYGMIYAGSALMVVNIIRYFLFIHNVCTFGGWNQGAGILYVPAVLLILFLVGYLTVGLFGRPDFVIAGILFGGSLFVFIILQVIRVIVYHIRQNERLKAALEEAQKANEAKTIFLSNMSHDIRTPMNAIIGYTRLAKAENATLPEIRTYLDKIDGSSQHLLALINDVLEMSRIESGKMELEEVSCDLTSIMNELQGMFATQMKEKGLFFTVDCDIRDPFVYTDKNRLNRILLNLVSNAFKFTPEGGSVLVTLHQEEVVSTGYGDYEFRVKDTGVGMAKEFIPRIFDAFEREHTSTISGIQGTGLGMAIVKNMTDLMGGTIRVESEPEKGTEFILRFPFRLCDPPAEPKEVHPDCPMTKEEREAAGFRMLLAEDVAVNREIAVMILNQEGIQVDTAENGREAVEKVKASPPGTYKAVLMDIQMPVMNGYEAARAIRALPDPERAGIPIIAVTANAFREDIQQALDAGMDGHVAKPIDPATLIQTLHTIVCSKSGSHAGQKSNVSVHSR